MAMTLEEAEAAVHDMLAGNAFGDAGHRIVIEEFLDGEEAKFIVMVDGEHVLPMATSQDHKRVGQKHWMNMRHGRLYPRAGSNR